MKYFCKSLTTFFIVTTLMISFLFGQAGDRETSTTKIYSIKSAAGLSQFTWLGGMIPSALSGDGNVIVGAKDGKAISWSDKTGMATLQHLRPTLPNAGSSANGVSYDGSVIVGYSVGDTITVPGGQLQSLVHAVRWSMFGAVTELPSMGHNVSLAYAVDSSGNNIVGNICSTYVVKPYGWGSIPYLGSDARASRWISGSPSHLPGINKVSGAFGISPDGSVVVGSDYTATVSAQTAVKWDNSGKSYLGFSWPPYSRAVCASRKGNDVIVNVTDPSPYWSYRLTAAGGKISLGSKTYSTVISADGKRIAGYMNKAGANQIAIIWDAGGTVAQDLKIFLQNNYKINLNKCELWTATGISADGNVIVGYGVDSLGRFGGYRVILDAGPAIQVWNPVKGSFWLAGTVDTIRWITRKKIDSVNIFLSTDSGVTQQQIAHGIPGNSGSFGWRMPDSIMSRKCIITVKEATDTAKGASGMFKVKGTYLTRINAAGQYEKFMQPRDQFSFGNEPQWMWPKSWWKQFNYLIAVDPVTGKLFPQDTFYPFRTAAESSFSDWPNFVNAFGVDQCYWTPTMYGYKEKALTKWSSVKSEWGGSCFGIATAALMAFDDKSRFLSAFPQVPSFSTLDGVLCTDSVRLVINQLFIYQFGATHDAHIEARWNTTTPTQTLQELRNDFLNDSRDVKTLNIYKHSKDQGSHIIVAYKIEHDTVNPRNYWISVYDNSYNTDYNARIKVDTVADTWDYSNWPGWGSDKGLFLLDPVSAYYTQDSLTNRVSSFGPPVITGGKQHLTSSKHWELYSSSRSSIIIKDLEGKRIGYQDQKLFNEIPGARSKILLNSKEAPPIGYLLPPGRYTITLGEAIDSTISFSLLSDSSVMTYQHRGIKSLQTDQLEINDHRSMRIVNSDSEPKKIDMKIVVEEQKAEKIFRLRNFDMQQGDSVSVGAIVNDQLQLSHTGTAPTKFDIRIEHNSKEGRTGMIFPRILQ